NPPGPGTEPRRCEAPVLVLLTMSVRPLESARVKASRDPSGDQLGHNSSAGEEATARSGPPANDTTWMSTSPPRERLYATHCPSAEIAACHAWVVPSVRERSSTTRRGRLPLNAR